MNSEELLNAIGEVGDDIVLRAKGPNKKKKMKKIGISLVAATLAVSLILVLVWNNMQVTANYSSKYNKVFGEFAASTTSKLLKKDKSNSCYSPVSLFAALAITAEATTGETREEILEAFGVDSLEELEEMYSKMIVDMNIDIEPKASDTLNSEGKPMYIPAFGPTKITLCNSLWLAEDYMDEGSDEVIERCMKNMSCEIFTDDYIKAADVNNWVSEKTNGLINDILEESYKGEIVLANTLYYKAGWEPELSSRSGSFYLEDGEEVETTFLSANKETLRYKQMDKYALVEVPLEEGEMMFILPTEGTKLESILREDILNQILSMSTNGELESGCVNISFPEFSCEDEFEGDLIQALKDMGVKKLWQNNQWEISEKLNGKNISIVQKTNIDVNKYGVEAAASTVGGSYLASNDSEVDLEITCDRPFLYVVMRNGVPMFIGTIYNPAE